MTLLHNYFKYIIAGFALTALLTFISCDKGISPYPENDNAGLTGFEGKVTFSGAWPDGIQQTYIVAFKETLKSDADFFPPNLSYIIGPISYNTTEYSYNSIDNNYSATFTLSPGSYNYVVVVQTKKTGLTLDRKDWTVAGIYYANGDTTKPGTLVIQNGKFTSNININCDFNNPPPQPPTIFNNENE